MNNRIIIISKILLLINAFVCSVDGLAAPEPLSIEHTIQSTELRDQTNLSGQPFALKLDMSNAPADSVGTDVSHIYIFTARNAGADAEEDENGNSQSYIVIFYLDDIFLEGFRDQTLPVSIKKNFQGLTTGQHRIRVDIEDNDNSGKVVATQTVIFTEAKATGLPVD